jgi:hypothetical protein
MGENRWLSRRKNAGALKTNDVFVCFEHISQSLASRYSEVLKAKYIAPQRYFS